MKEKEIREGLNRLLSERENPDKVKGVLNRLIGEQGTPVENKSVPDRLWVLRERIKNLTEEAENLSPLLGYHSGSRLSQVIDLLNKAQDLTEETMSLTTEQAPSRGFRVNDDGRVITIRDDIVGVGIEFTKWDGENQVRLSYIHSEEAQFKDEGVISRTFDRLIEFAREKYPQEFEHLPDDPRI